jgi:MATE family multidrug resistance protein
LRLRRSRRATIGVAVRFFLKPPLSPAELRHWWSGRAGYREVLALAGPLVLSTGSLSIQHFVDRMFLAWHSPEAMAATLPAGILSFTFVGFFMGTASYVNTFVAQYHGARQSHRIGPAVWQALFFSLLAGIALAALAPLAGPLFRLAGHAPELQALEMPYYRIMCYCGGLIVYSSAISGFFTGRGRPWTVMWINVGQTSINIVLDYAWIFGRWGFPQGGIVGAAWATAASSLFSAVAFTIIFLSRTHRRDFSTHRPRLDRVILGRLMRFGLPSGFHFMLDIMSFNLFVQCVGRMGTLELGATNVALQINTLAFLPMFGFGIAAQALVGQGMGEGRADLAARATWSTFHLAFGYMALFALFYLVAPAIFVEPFAVKADPVQFIAIRRLAIVILRFVAIYCVFDTMNIVFASALKGAGDTRFVMIWSLVLGWLLMVLPTWWASGQGTAGIYYAWAALSLYVIAIGIVFLARFLQGKWIDLRVIESPLAPPVPVFPIPESPGAEADL